MATSINDDRHWLYCVCIYIMCCVCVSVSQFSFATYEPRPKPWPTSDDVWSCVTATVRVKNEEEEIESVWWHDVFRCLCACVWLCLCVCTVIDFLFSLFVFIFFKPTRAGFRIRLGFIRSNWVGKIVSNQILLSIQFDPNLFFLLDWFESNILPTSNNKVYNSFY